MLCARGAIWGSTSACMNACVKEISTSASQMSLNLLGRYLI